MESAPGLIGQPAAGSNSVPSHPTPLQSLAAGSTPPKATTEMRSPPTEVPTPTEADASMAPDAQGLGDSIPSLEGTDEMSTLTAAQGTSVPALDASGLANGLRTMEGLAKMGSLGDKPIGAGAVATGLTCLPCRLAKVCFLKKRLLLEIDFHINPVVPLPWPRYSVAPPLAGEMRQSHPL